MATTAWNNQTTAWTPPPWEEKTLFWGGARKQVLEYRLELFSRYLDLNLGRSMDLDFWAKYLADLSLSQNYSFTTQTLSPVKKYTPKFEQAKLLCNVSNEVFIRNVHIIFVKLQKLRLQNSTCTSFAVEKSTSISKSSTPQLRELNFERCLKMRK